MDMNVINGNPPGPGPDINQIPVPQGNNRNKEIALQVFNIGMTALSFAPVIGEFGQVARVISPKNLEIVAKFAQGTQMITNDVVEAQKESKGNLLLKGVQKVAEYTSFGAGIIGLACPITLPITAPLGTVLGLIGTGISLIN